MNDAEKSYGVIYARYSSHNQREESIEDQVRECKEYAERMGITVLHEYADKAISGTTDHRPQFQQMIKDSAKRVWQYVIVYKVDRFARDRYDSANYRAKLKKNGVKVLSAKEAIPDGPEGIILESVLEGYAEYYSANLSQNIRRGMEGNALNCKSNGGRRLLGYQSAPDGTLTVDASEAAIVRYIFSHFVAGDSQSEIIRQLNAKGLKTATGKPFCKTSTHSILHNEKYTGIYKFNGTRIENGIPSIISPQQFAAAQKRFSVEKHKCRKPSKHVDYILTTKLFCGMCGSGMVGRCGTSRNGTAYPYYDCLSHIGRKGCHQRAVRQDLLENLVLSVTYNYVLQDSIIDRIAAGVVDYEHRTQSSDMLHPLESKLRATEKSIKNLISAMEAGIITASTKERLEQLESEKNELCAAIATEKVKNPIFTYDQLVFFLQQFRAWNIKDGAYQKKLVDTFVNSVFYFPDKIVIAYNYSGEGNKITLDDLKKYLPACEGDSSELLSGSDKFALVEHSGLEPLTSTLPVWRSPS